MSTELRETETLEMPEFTEPTAMGDLLNDREATKTANDDWSLSALDGDSAVQAEPPTEKPCHECGGSGDDHPASAAYRNSQYGTLCPVCNGTGKEPVTTTPTLAVDGEAGAAGELSAESVPGNVFANNTSTNTANAERTAASIKAEAAHAEAIQNAEAYLCECVLHQRQLKAAAKEAGESVKEAAEALESLQRKGPARLALSEAVRVAAGPLDMPTEPTGNGTPNTCETYANTNAQPNTNEAWRTVPITELHLDKIKGLGKKKRENLIATCPTIGALEDLRAQTTQYEHALMQIDGIGRQLADKIEDALLDWLTKNRDKAVLAASAGKITAEDGTEVPLNISSQKPLVYESTAIAPTNVQSAQPTPEPSDQQRIAQIQARSEQLDNGQPNSLDSTHPAGDGWWKSGYHAEESGELQLEDCPYTPGPEQDDWIRGYLASELVEGFDTEEMGPEDGMQTEQQ